jgi:predicted O-linked N-acetylglucosamine transferase (SPINDLY family)
VTKLPATMERAIVYFQQGNTQTALGNLDAALACYDQALAANDDFLEAHFNRGVVLVRLNQSEAALAAYDRAIEINVKFAIAHFNRAAVLTVLGQFDAAIHAYGEAITYRPDYAEAYCNRGILLERCGELATALASYDQALALRSDLNEALLNRGNTLRKLGHRAAALDSYERCLGLNPGHAEACYNCGNMLQELHRPDEALAQFDRAIAIKPEYAEAHHNRGNVLRDMKRYAEAIASYDRALICSMDLPYVRGQRQLAKMQICDWVNFDAEVSDIAARVARHESAIAPYALLLMSESESLHKNAAELWLHEQCRPEQAQPAAPPRRTAQRLRIGYFSPDFREHPVAQLAAELFETHDPSRVETIAFSFGPNTRDVMRARLESAFDQFLDVSAQSAQQIALLARQMQIDVAVDLGGFTENCRPQIFAARAAPIQVGYLGYPGTLGAGHLDYLIADRTIIPETHRDGYAERIIYLPDCYLPNDSQRRVAAREFTRHEAGLPATGFVFCCFNNNAKITPAVFGIWMRILRRVSGSVLWLSATNVTAADNLRRAALDHEVGPERLIFAQRLPSNAQHLARHRLADLFIDTLPYNAHATASDALWAGLPVLTRSGESFAGRVAASLLRAIDLPELITSTPREYEDLAVALAGDAARLAAIKRRLESNRSMTAAFDTQRLATHLETAYAAIYSRSQAGLSPADMDITAG